MSKNPVKPFQNIDIVLVRPLRPGNIGSAARAMKNMGFSSLSLVDACNHLVSEAYQMAYGAHDVLEGAKHYATLSEASSVPTLNGLPVLTYREILVFLLKCNFSI
ncbi:MAG TPA: TrmH family RNA methyltransferase [Nitrospiria bacterium]|jgi:tRNA C32,U32 (ribose-2'-O)-methylase TrmJ